MRCGELQTHGTPSISAGPKTRVFSKNDKLIRMTGRQTVTLLEKLWALSILLDDPKKIQIANVGQKLISLLNKIQQLSFEEITNRTQEITDLFLKINPKIAQRPNWLSFINLSWCLKNCGPLKSYLTQRWEALHPLCRPFSLSKILLKPVCQYWLCKFVYKKEKERKPPQNKISFV